MRDKRSGTSGGYPGDHSGDYFARQKVGDSSGELIGRLFEGLLYETKMRGPIRGLRGGLLYEIKRSGAQAGAFSGAYLDLLAVELTVVTDIVSGNVHAEHPSTLC